MPHRLTRRRFALTGGAALLLAPTGPARANLTRAVETPLGRVAIPLAPRRVIAIDSRISLESGLALGLPLIGYSHSRARPWVPVPGDVPFLAAPPDLEQVLMLAPDLILCPDASPHSDWWPLARLQAVGPVLPSNHLLSWQANLRRLAGWLDKVDSAEAIIAEHAARVATIRTGHARAIDRSLVAAVHFDAIKRRMLVRSAGTGYGHVMPAQVLADLGGREVGAAVLGPYGEVALEAFGDVLGGVHGFLLIDFGDGGPQALAREPLWQRLPAVRAGRVQSVAGNCTFGASYTARYLLSAWEALYARLSG
ncbi:MAG TPA: ABC transporter substrate-binding protein [Bosea sp. (in: a-proteobacteria)]